MIGLDKLNQIDIQNFDSAQLVKILTKHQHTLIKAVLLTGSLLMAVGMFNDYQSKGRGLRAQISQARDKIEVIKVRDAAVRDLGNFKASLPKELDEFEVTKTIRGYAKSQDVDITSLSPGETRDMGLYDAIPVNLTAVAGNFKGMMLFLIQIEKSNLPLRVDALSGRKDAGGKIIFEIQVSGVLIHP